MARFDLEIFEKKKKPILIKTGFGGVNIENITEWQQLYGSKRQNNYVRLFGIKPQPSSKVLE